MSIFSGNYGEDQHTQSQAVMMLYDNPYKSKDVLHAGHANQVTSMLDITRSGIHDRAKISKQAASLKNSAV